MGWSARLDLHYSRDNLATQVKFEHEGPLRILRSLYPEGPSICHNILIHPPSGLVGGDSLDINISAQGAAHALITTPGATRFYKSESEWATQTINATLHDSARLEWLPLETLAYNGCKAKNQCIFDLKDNSQLIAWDITALGMPSANLPFEMGLIEQHFELKGHWLDRGRINAEDLGLLRSPLGLNGKKCVSTLVFASARALTQSESSRLLALAREALAPSSVQVQAGVTSPNEHIVVLRMLTDLVEPSMHLMRRVWLSWRSTVWGLPAVMPRIWAL